MQAGKGVADAYKQRLFSRLQEDAITNQMSEITTQTNNTVTQIQAQGKKVISAQEQAYLKGGVELEGSAMDVISETMSDVAEASYARQREAGFQLEGAAMDRAKAKQAGSDLNFLLNSAAAVGNAYASYQGGKSKYAAKGIE